MFSGVDYFNILYNFYVKECHYCLIESISENMKTQKTNYVHSRTRQSNSTQDDFQIFPVAGHFDPVYMCFIYLNEKMYTSITTISFLRSFDTIFHTLLSRNAFQAAFLRRFPNPLTELIVSITVFVFRMSRIYRALASGNLKLLLKETCLKSVSEFRVFKLNQEDLTKQSLTV